MPDGDVAQTRRFNWRVKWKGVVLGYVDEVDPGIVLKFDPIMVGSVGKAKLGDRFVGLDAKCKIQLREINRAQIERLHPWGSGTSLAGTPPINKDMYEYADVLNFHPTDLLDGDVTQDINILKAVPTQPLSVKADGQKDNEWNSTWEFYPDRSKLPALVYFWVGPIAA